jgi:hypothetical protein
MGLMTGMAGFLGFAKLDAFKKTQIREEIDLMDAIQAHVMWKLKLQDCIDGKSKEKLDPMVICRDDQCTLGKWIHGPAMRHFHEDETFHQLRANHAQFHFVAGSVVQKVQANDHAAAEVLMKGEYQAVSHKVMIELAELNQHLND